MKILIYITDVNWPHRIWRISKTAAVSDISTIIHSTKYCPIIIIEKIPQEIEIYFFSISHTPTAHFKCNIKHSASCAMKPNWNWKQNTGVSKANTASSHIWLKTKLRIHSEILRIPPESLESKSRCIDGSIYSPNPIAPLLQSITWIQNTIKPETKTRLSLISWKRKSLLFLCLHRETY